MASKWGGGKQKIKDRDLDAEFEKFLNESLSDESLASPRRSLTSMTTKQKAKGALPSPNEQQKFDKPWWATSEDDVTASENANKKKWIKSKEDTIDEVDGIDAPPKQTNNPLAMSRDSLDVNSSRPGTALDTILSESEPSYSEPVKTETEQEPDGVDAGGTQYEEDFTGSTNSQSSVSGNTVNPSSTTQNQEMGMETLEEMKDKDLFFSQLEKEKQDDIDYGELNRKLDEEESMTNEGMSVLGLQPYRPPHYDDSGSGSGIEDDQKVNYTKESPSKSLQSRDTETQRETSQTNSSVQSSPTRKERSYSEKSDVDSFSRREDEQVEQKADEQLNLNEPSPAKTKKPEAVPSLLSKVSLMESLDSTAGLNLAEKLAQRNKEFTGKGSTAAKSKASFQPQDESYLRTGDTTIEFAEALSNVKQLSTQSFGVRTSEEKPAEIVQDLSKAAVPSGKPLFDLENEQSLKRSEFDLQPVISNFAEEPKIPTSSNPNMFSKTGISNVSLNSGMATHSQLNNLHTFSDINELIVNAVVDQLVQDPHNISKNIPSQEDGRGFSLQPIGTLLHSDSDGSPPTDSLKIIKSIAEERKKKLIKKSKVQRDLSRVLGETESSSSAKKQRRKTKAETPRGSTNNIKKRTSSSPSMGTLSFPTFRKNKEQTKDKPPKPRSPQKRPTPNLSPAKRKTDLSSKSKTPEELMASIEVLTASLQEFRQDAEQRDLNLNSTLLDKSIIRDKGTHLSSLQREQDLQSQLRDLRLNYDELLNSYELIQKQLRAQQDRFTRTKEELTLEYDRKLKDLNEELFIVRNKLEMAEQDRKTALDLKTKQFTELSKEDVESLQKQLQQQEALLTGYQQENERLYKEAKDKTNDMKKIESKMFEENQKLASEVGNLKEELEKRPKLSSMSTSASFGAAKITQLDNQVKFYKTREEEHKEHALGLDNEILLLKKKLHQSEQHRHNTLTEEGLLKQIEEMQILHKEETSKLHKKLKWYSENQQLLDRDMVVLKDKRDEIKELRELVDRLETENQRLRKDKASNQSEKNSDSTTILDLKRQVKEMEDIIRRRHPNSIPALIYAASAIPGEKKVYESVEASKNVSAYLEKQIKTLEKELEDRDEINSRKVRAIEQQYNAMTFRYEDHIKQLQVQSVSVNNQTMKSVSELEAELSRQKSEYEDIINSLRERSKSVENKLKLEERASKTSSRSNNKQDLARLKTKLISREAEIEELKSTLILLQREREDLLAREVESDERNLIRKTRSRLTDHSTSPLVGAEAIERYHDLEKENKRLRQKVEELYLDVKEKQIRQEAREAQILSEKRQFEEQFAERMRTDQLTHEREIEKLKMQYAIDHSNSKVAELNGKLKSCELMIQHLNQRVDDSKEDREKLSKCKLVEDNLRKDILQLQEELSEARKHFTPEMHHYKMLESKIANMESRHVYRENELQNVLEKTNARHSVDVTHIEDKWREVLREKDSELMKFREELDAILEVLRELKRQGIILPLSSSDAKHLIL
ncbi:centrosomal protein of 162 kDa-like isoform X2 [Clytia hemisphaerica]|uniref:centrosomal protein of 162 kDa-like isoform X2 n=1 Tax=Clytia hemisphaerica TaxID=252671 RepID=UPI0034D6CF3F